MKNANSAKRITATLLVLLIAALARAGAASEAVAAHGVVKGVDPTRGEVTIEHDDIPGLMKGMTMQFSVDDPTQLRNLRAGDEVDFAVKKEGGRYVVTEIRRATEGGRTEGAGPEDGDTMGMGMCACCGGMMKH